MSCAPGLRISEEISDRASHPESLVGRGESAKSEQGAGTLPIIWSAPCRVKHDSEIWNLPGRVSCFLGCRRAPIARNPTFPGNAGRFSLARRLLYRKAAVRCHLVRRRIHSSFRNRSPAGACCTHSRCTPGTAARPFRRPLTGHLHGNRSERSGSEHPDSVSGLNFEPERAFSLVRNAFPRTQLPPNARNCPEISHKGSACHRYRMGV